MKIIFDNEAEKDIFINKAFDIDLCPGAAKSVGKKRYLWR